MRELYEQFIAYSHAYAERIPTYTAADDHLAGVANSADGLHRRYLCSHQLWLGSGARTTDATHSGDTVSDRTAGQSDRPSAIPAGPNSVCADWVAACLSSGKDTADWLAIPSDIPASQWTPEQRAINDAVAPVMDSFADKFKHLANEAAT